MHSATGVVFPGFPASDPAHALTLAPGTRLWELGADDGPKACNKHAGLHVLGPLALRNWPFVPAERSAARLAHQSGGLGVWRPLGPSPEVLSSKLNPHTNSTAFRSVSSDTSQYNAVVPIWRCPISF